MQESVPIWRQKAIEAYKKSALYEQDRYRLEKEVRALVSVLRELGIDDDIDDPRFTKDGVTFTAHDVGAGISVQAHEKCSLCGGSGHSPSLLVHDTTFEIMLFAKQEELGIEPSAILGQWLNQVHRCNVKENTEPAGVRRWEGIQHGSHDEASGNV